MDRPPTACVQCSEPFEGAGHYCEKCRTLVPRLSDERDQAKRKLYRQKRWKDFRLQVLRSNPICQALEHGHQCNRAGVELHHLVSPLVDIAGMYNWRNLVALCRQHHAKTTGEDAANPHSYVPTKNTRAGVTEIQEHGKVTTNSSNLTGLPEWAR